jgi:hypothetical protein
MSGKNTFSSESTRNKMNAEGKTRQSGHGEAQVNIHWSMMNSLYNSQAKPDKLWREFLKINTDGCYNSDDVHY